MKQEHFHCYRSNTSGRIFKCSKEGCTHQINRDLLESRIAECPFCQITFKITKQLMRRKVIHCGECTKHGKSINASADKIFSDLLQTPEPTKDIIDDPTRIS